MPFANPERGEVALVVKRVNAETGEETTTEYVLKMGMNAAVALQQRLKKPLAQVVKELDQMDMTAARDLAFMFLQKHHSKEINSLEKAGDVVDDAGGPMAFFKAFKVLLEVNSKVANGDDPNAPTAQPPTTGGDSTSTPAGSV